MNTAKPCLLLLLLGVCCNLLLHHCCCIQVAWQHCGQVTALHAAVCPNEKLGICPHRCLQKQLPAVCHSCQEKLHLLLLVMQRWKCCRMMLRDAA